MIKGSPTTREGNNMPNGRTIIDYPDVDSFFDDVELSMREELEPGFSSRTLLDPYCGRGGSFSYVTKSKTSYSIELSFGFTDSLFKLDVDLSTPFDAKKWNTRGDEDSHSLYPLRTFGAKLAVLWMQVSIEFTRH
jgi:hypothetical protein